MSEEVTLNKIGLLDQCLKLKDELVKTDPKMENIEITEEFKDWYFTIKDLFLPYIRHKITFVFNSKDLEDLKKHIHKISVDIVGTKLSYLGLSVEEISAYVLFSSRLYDKLENYIDEKYQELNNKDNE